MSWPYFAAGVATVLAAMVARHQWNKHRCPDAEGWFHDWHEVGWTAMHYHQPDAIYTEIANFRCRKCHLHCVVYTTRNE